MDKCDKFNSTQKWIKIIAFYLSLLIAKIDIIFYRNRLKFYDFPVTLWFKSNKTHGFATSISTQMLTDQRFERNWNIPNAMDGSSVGINVHKVAMPIIKWMGLMSYRCALFGVRERWRLGILFVWYGKRRVSFLCEKETGR